MIVGPVENAKVRAFRSKVLLCCCLMLKGYVKGVAEVQIKSWEKKWKKGVEARRQHPVRYPRTAGVR